MDIIVIIIMLWPEPASFSVNLLASLTGQQASAQATTREQTESTVTIRPAAEVNNVSAAGNIALAGQQAVALQVEGIVTEVAVKAGDEVAAGDLLLALDTADLERAVQRAELTVATSQAALDKLLEPATEADIAAAQGQSGRRSGKPGRPESRSYRYRTGRRPDGSDRRPGKLPGIN